MSGATAEADDDDFVMGAVLLLALFLNVVFDVCGAAFVYKVWNERQQTHVYEREAAALERIANAAERAHPAPIEPKPIAPLYCSQLPTLGGTSVEHMAGGACGPSLR